MHEEFEIFKLWKFFEVGSVFEAITLLEFVCKCLQQALSLILLGADYHMEFAGLELEVSDWFCCLSGFIFRFLEAVIKGDP